MEVEEPFGENVGRLDSFPNPASDGEVRKAWRAIFLLGGVVRVVVRGVVGEVIT